MIYTVYYLYMFCARCCCVLCHSLYCANCKYSREQHSIAVDTDGVAYSWGCGGSGWEGAGALGVGAMEKHIVSTPTEIRALSDIGAKV